MIVNNGILFSSGIIISNWKGIKFHFNSLTFDERKEFHFITWIHLISANTITIILYEWVWMVFTTYSIFTTYKPCVKQNLLQKSKVQEQFGFFCVFDARNEKHLSQIIHEHTKKIINQEWWIIISLLQTIEWMHHKMESLHMLMISKNYLKNGLIASIQFFIVLWYHLLSLFLLLLQSKA